MFAQINHMAVISHQYPLLERFYRSHFNFSVAQRGAHDAEAAAEPQVNVLGGDAGPERGGDVYLDRFRHPRPDFPGRQHAGHFRRPDADHEGAESARRG